MIQRTDAEIAKARKAFEEGLLAVERDVKRLYDAGHIKAMDEVIDAASGLLMAKDVFEWFTTGNETRFTEFITESEEAAK